VCFIFMGVETPSSQHTFHVEGKSRVSTLNGVFYLQDRM